MIVSMINRLQNIQPGEHICYWETGVYMPWNKTDVFTEANRKHDADEVELVQEKIKTIPPGPLGWRETSEFKYFAIGKKYPPDPEKIALRKREKRRLANEPDLVGGVV